MLYDVCVVGAGLTGLTAARKIAEAGKKVLVVERSNQIGGLCREGYYKGTRFSLFGPHIFHTDDEYVWQFLSQFTDWNFYTHYVKSFCKGKLWSIPIDYTEGGQAEWLKILLKEYLYVDYTKKMWGDYAEKVESGSLKRLNISSPLDKRYFKDKYQALPANGYNEMFLKMTEIKTMSVLTGTIFKMDDYDSDTPIIYTGRIDKLIWRTDLPFMTMGFHYELDGKFSWSDKYGVINFPQDYDFIRAHSSKILHQQNTEHDVIVYEYPNGGIGPECYPIVFADSTNLYNVIASKVRDTWPNIIPAGRAGKFQHMDMGQAVRDGLNAAEGVMKRMRGE